MGKNTTLRAVAVGALLLPSMALAQAQDGGVVLTFGVDQRLGVGNNLGLETPSEGQTRAADTTLSFGLTSTTPSQRLSIGGSTAYRLADEPGGSVSDFEAPRLNFVYSREAANADLSVSGRYRRDRVDYLRDLTQFLDAEGNLDLPEDFDKLSGTGRRADYALDATLNLGTAAPLGLSLTAGVSGIDYSNVTASDLNDIRRTRLGATTRLRFSPVSEGSVTLSRSTSDEDNAAQTKITRDGVEFGLKQEVSPRARFDAGIGYSVIDTEEFGTTTREKGLTTRFGMVYDMPDGRYSADLSGTTDENGNRATLSFGRVRDLPDGSIAARVGITRADWGDTALVGGLTWRRALRDGGVSASLDRSVRTTDPNVETTVTALSVNYNRDINAVSGVSLGMNYAETRETGTNDIARAGLSASYRHALTEDWTMNLGLAWRMRDEATVGRATSEEVFLSLSRDFTWRR